MYNGEGGYEVGLEVPQFLKTLVEEEGLRILEVNRGTEFVTVVISWPGDDRSVLRSVPSGVGTNNRKRSGFRINFGYELNSRGSLDPRIQLIFRG